MKQETAAAHSTVPKTDLQCCTEVHWTLANSTRKDHLITLITPNHTSFSSGWSAQGPMKAGLYTTRALLFEHTQRPASFSSAKGMEAACRS